MTTSPIAGDSQIATALTTIGTTALADTRNDLLKQLIVAAANATGGGSGSAAWGDITGTLSAQTDLQAALDAKLTMEGRAVDAAVSTYIGLDAGALALDTDTKNTAVGAYALATASGHGADSANVAFGFKALQLLTTGNSNVAIGTGAMLAETTGTNNTAVGHHALLDANGASNNVVIGYRAADSLTTGGSNVVVGTDAMSNGAVTGSDNTAVGNQAGYGMTSGGTNSLLGSSSGKNITTGSNNACIGYLSGFGVTTASGNICIGTSAGQNTTGANSVFIGHNAGQNETGGEKLYIANSNTATPLIGGDFSAGTVAIQGDLALGNPAASPTARKLNAGNGTGTDINGSSLTLAGGQSTGSGTGGSVLIKTAPAGSSGSSANALVTTLEVRHDGLIILSNVPTSDPAVSGAIWNNGGFLKISA